MYYCQDCGCEFEAPQIIVEKHSLGNPPFERFFVCPSCKGVNYKEKKSTHCRCCGVKLKGKGDYCSSYCREKGKKMWQAERRRRQLNFTNPIAVLVREAEEYNRKNGTRYSYGQYVALAR